MYFLEIDHSTLFNCIQIPTKFPVPFIKWLEHHEFDSAPKVKTCFFICVQQTEPYPLLLPLWYVLVIQGVHQQMFDLTSRITQIYNFKSAAWRKNTSAYKTLLPSTVELHGKSAVEGSFPDISVVNKVYQ